LPLARYGPLRWTRERLLLLPEARSTLQYVPIWALAPPALAACLMLEASSC
jgi:hypothetical protein